MLDRQAILSASDISLAEVKVPEWGGSVWVRVMDGRARDALDAFLARAIDKSGKLANPQGMRTLVVRLTVCDEAGNALFSEQDDDALANKSSVVLDRIFHAAARLNGISDSAIEDARETF